MNVVSACSLRGSGGTWRQLLGPKTTPTGQALFPNDVVSSIAAEPGTEGAWMSLQTQFDEELPSPTSRAAVARMSPEGTVTDQQQLPAAGEGIGPKGAGVKSVCPAPHDCWLVTTQGWLFHLTTGKEELPQDTDPAFAGLITERTRPFYATYVDMDELQAEGSRMPGDDIAEEGIRYLQAINFKESADRGAAQLVAAE